MADNKSVIISTLGPSGTCSEYTSQYYLERNNIIGKIMLYSSFEEAIEILINKKSDIAIVPSAYRNFSKLIFENNNKIKITNSFMYDTPNLAIARKNLETNVTKIATHPSPSSLVQRVYPDAEIVFAESNSKAALMLLNGEVEACMTNYICVEKYGFSIVEDFGPISMSWNVFERI